MITLSQAFEKLVKLRNISARLTKKKKKKRKRKPAISLKYFPLSKPGRLAEGRTNRGHVIRAEQISNCE
jgi:hypothetical protein